MKIGVFIQIFFIFSIFTLNSFAQVRTITQAEYDSQLKAAFAATNKLNRRVTTSTDSFDEGNRSGTEIFIEEFQPPNKQRSVRTARAGKKSTTYEIIEVNDASYRRVDLGIWAKFRRPEGAVYELRGVPSPDDPKEVIKFSSTNAKLNGQPVRILSKISNKAYGFLMGAQTNETWINSDGLVLKTVEIISEDAPKNITEKAIAKYEYNPKGLKIEEPIK